MKLGCNESRAVKHKHPIILQCMLIKCMATNHHEPESYFMNRWVQISTTLAHMTAQADFRHWKAFNSPPCPFPQPAVMQLVMSSRIDWTTWGTLWCICSAYSITSHAQPDWLHPAAETATPDELASGEDLHIVNIIHTIWTETITPRDHASESMCFIKETIKSSFESSQGHAWLCWDDLSLGMPIVGCRPNKGVSIAITELDS